MRTAKFKEGLLEDFLETSIALSETDDRLIDDLKEYLKKTEWHPVRNSQSEDLCYLLLPSKLKVRQFHRGLLVEKSKLMFSNNTLLKLDYVEIFKEMI